MGMARGVAALLLAALSVLVPVAAVLALSGCGASGPRYPKLQISSLLVPPTAPPYL